MNNTRNLVILAVVLVVLGGISLLQGASHRQQTSQAATEVLVPDTYGVDDLDRITLGQGDKEVVVDLVRDPDGWKVVSAWNAAAADNRLDGMLKAVSGLSGEFRSDNAGVVADYGLDDSTAVHIRCYKDGKPVVSLEVGELAKNHPGNFVRQTGSPKVYLSNVSLLSPLGIYGELTAPKSRQFLELQAVKEDRLAVDRIVIRDGNSTLEMHKEFAMIQPDTSGGEPAPDRNTWEWQLDEPRSVALAKTKTDGVLGTLVSIRATDVGDPGADPAVYGLDQPPRSATLVMNDGSEVVLEFGIERETVGDHPGGTYLRVQGKDTVWVANNYTVKNIFKELDDLLPDTK
ncbi:DUF4340 domain-containing protein [bacterium]|nr:DUF4340 domain-containing protein [bacterium]PJA73927.1 MAG: hypothetical protein CO151_11115 [bacterium CG_4_9_14_3_um_filter_65_15]